MQLRPPLSVPRPLREVSSERRKIEAVKHRRARNASFPRQSQLPDDKVDFIYRVRVGIDAQQAAELKGPLVPPPIKVEPPRVCVDFDGDALRCTGRKKALDFNFITGTTEKLPSCHVSENGRIRILDSARNARRLCFTIQRESAMDARDYKIELTQHLIWIVQRSIGENVGIYSFENAKVPSVLLIETVNRGVLLTDLLKRQSAGVVGGARMIGNS